jgi:tetratricopeptide (TPR) repeat protein
MSSTMTAAQWQALQAQLDVLLPLDPAGRQLALQNIARDDVPTAELLQALLAAEDRMPDAPDAVTVARAFATASAGQTVGAFVLDALVGEGGSSVVFRAHRASDFTQTVAIKILRTVSGKDFHTRFQRERDILAGLNHPNIARLYDAGATPDGQPFLVLEHVEGTELVTWARRPHQTLADVVTVMIKVCDAVDYAHRSLLVHRDLKPANILIDELGEPKLLDFGVAKLLDSDSNDLTRDAGAPLTAAYAAPEQLQGGPITTATDVYALGVILYEVLTGRHPYRQTGDTALQVLHHLVTSEPARPSATAATHSAGGGPTALLARRSDLDDVILCAIDKRPEARYASARALGDDLRAALAGRPVAARPRTWRYLAGRFVARHRWPVAVSAAALTAVVGAVAVALWQGQVAEAQRSVAERRFGDVRQQANRLIFSYYDGIKSLPGSLPVQRQLVQDALQYLSALRREAGGNAHDAQLLIELADAYARIGDIQGNFTEANQGDFDGAAGSYRTANNLLELAVSAGGEAQAVTEARASLLLKEAHLAYQRVDLPVASGRYESAVAAWRQASGSQPRRTEARLNLAAALDAHGDFLGRDGGKGMSNPAAALALYAEARQIRAEIAKSAPDFPGLQSALYESDLRDGESAWALGRKTDAVALYETALASARRLAAAEPNNSYRQRELAIVLTRLVPAYEAVDRLDASVAAAVDAAQLMQKMLSADAGNEAMRSGVTSSAGWAARQLIKAGRLDDAEPYVRVEMKMAQERLEAAPGDVDAQATLALAHRRAGYLAFGRNQFDLAAEAHMRARAMQMKFRDTAPENAAAAALSLMHAGRAHVGARRGAEARHALNTAIIEMQALVATHPNARFQDSLIEAFELLGDALLLPKSDAAKAHKAYRNALEIIDVAAAKRTFAASEVRRRTLIADKLRKIQ